LDSDGTNLGESGESKVSIVKECMEKIAKNFDDSNTEITSLIKQKCSLCQNEFYFLREYEKKKKTAQDIVVFVLVQLKIVKSLYQD
jgi:hypothetical protein